MTKHWHCTAIAFWKNKAASIDNSGDGGTGLIDKSRNVITDEHWSGGEPK